MNKYKRIREYNKFLLSKERGNTIDINNKTKSKYKVGICFASEYKYAMHTIGFQYTYFKINHNKNFFCQRVYYPEKRFIKIYKRNKLPLISHETNDPIKNFDILFFSLNYEGNYPKLFEMLELGKIQPFAVSRDEKDPILIAGGICMTYNPEPLSDFFDVIVVGDAESVVAKILRIYNKLRSRRNYTKHWFLKRVSKYKGVYVPLFGKLKRIKKAYTKSINNNFLGYIVSPFTAEPDYFFLEIMRGCDRGCKFCVLSKSFQKSRLRNKKEIIKIAKYMLQYTNKIRLVTPSDVDHPDIISIYAKLKEMGYKLKTGSQRADMIKKNEEIFSYVKPYKLTIAPESASLRIRKIIGKNISDKDIYRTLKIVAKYNVPKLQFFYIIGFPNEKRKDIMRIVTFTKQVRRYLNKLGANNTKIELVINSHIKKPHTYFERKEQQNIGEYFRYIDIIRSMLRKYGVKLKSMDKDMLVLECILARGSNIDGRLIYSIYKEKKSIYIKEKDILDKLGEKFNKYFKYFEGRLPWEHISLSV